MTASVGGNSGNGGSGGGGGDSVRRREFVGGDGWYQVQSCVASGSIGSMMSLQIRASLV